MSRPRPARHLLDLSSEERRAALVELGLPAFRADQISRQWLIRLSDEPQTWTDLPADVRERVSAALLPRILEPVKQVSCDDGTTVKTAWRLSDGAVVESVLMRYPDRVTMCVSSQAGCGMACPFCATGQQGLTRNLTTAEIVEQVLAGARALQRGEIPGGNSGGGADRVSNVVFMGMGEPLANYERVVDAIHRLVDPAPAGLGMSARGITVSTVGLVPKMVELAGLGLPVTLALSLHAPDDELRDTLVPINQRWPVSEVLSALWAYAERTHRRVSIEYALIRDVNDQAWRAELLADLIAGQLVHVNLIPLNPTPGSQWTASRKEDERTFVRTLMARGVAVTVRDTRGRQIDGACGQLAITTL